MFDLAEDIISKLLETVELNISIAELILCFSMNKFMVFVFASVILSSNARPDLSLGYRYHQGHSSGGGSFLQAPGPVSTSYSPTASGNSYFSSQPSVGQVGNSGFVPSSQQGISHESTNIGTGFTGIGGPSYNGIGGIGSSSLNPGFGSNTQFNSGSVYQTHEGVQTSFSAPVISKHFYLHTAPSYDDEEEIVRHIQIGQPQKNYKVVFIDTPSSHSSKAKIIADVAPTEEKTAIYVLSKKNSILDINTEVNTPAPINNKPEVFFVKYKTPEEAIHAQHTIQAQYDALGGTSDISNEGQIPVSSVIGSLDGSHGNNAIATSDESTHGISTPVEITHTGINTQQTYLPANHK